jgi:hypothetical protein
MEVGVSPGPQAAADLRPCGASFEIDIRLPQRILEGGFGALDAGREPPECG